MWILPGQNTDSTFVYKMRPITVIADRYSRTTDVSNVVAKMPLEIRTTPVQVEIVTRKALEEKQAKTLSDALSQLTSINVQSSLGTSDYFIIRGYNSNTSGLVLYDGAPDPNISLFDFFGFGFHNMYNVDQVEVLLGPASFLYGGNSLSGAINLIHKQATFTPHKKMTLSHGSYRSYLETFDLNFGKRHQPLATRINGMWQESRTSRPHTFVRSYGLNPAFHWQINWYSSLSLTVEYQHQDGVPDVGIPFFQDEDGWHLPLELKGLSYQSNKDEIQYNSLRFRADYFRKISKTSHMNNKLYMKALDGFSYFTMLRLPEYNSMVGQVTVGRHVYGFYDNMTLVGNQFDYYKSLHLSRMSHSIMTGIETRLIRSQTRQKFLPLDWVYLFHPEDPVAADSLFQTRLNALTNETSLNLAGYCVDFISLFSRVQLFLGMRLDYLFFFTDRTNSELQIVGQVLTSTPTAVERDVIKLSPMMGVVYNETDDLSIYINASRAFGSGTRIVDDPEFSTQFEGGVKFRALNNRIQSTLSLYSLRRDNISVPLTGPLQGNIYTSIGAQETSGLDIYAHYISPSGWYASVSTSFTISAMVSFRALTATEDGKTTISDFSGHSPVFTPTEIQQVSLRKDFPSGAMVGAGFRLVSDQYINYENTLWVEGYQTNFVLISYRHNNAAVQINAEKILSNNVFARGLGPFTVLPVAPWKITGMVQVAL